MTLTRNERRDIVVAALREAGHSARAIDHYDGGFNVSQAIRPEELHRAMDLARIAAGRRPRTFIEWLEGARRTARSTTPTADNWQRRLSGWGLEGEQEGAPT